MKYWAMICVATMAAALSGCHKNGPTDWAEATDQPGFFGLGGKHGRFGAVGIYSPGDSWSKLVLTATQTDPAAARLADDQAIIVVTDSQTGEVRACGDLTGYCIGMNPWKAQLLGGQTTPIRLKEHVKPAVGNPTIDLTIKHVPPPKPVPPAPRAAPSAPSDAPYTNSPQ